MSPLNNQRIIVLNQIKPNYSRNVEGNSQMNCLLIHHQAYLPKNDTCKPILSRNTAPSLFVCVINVYHTCWPFSLIWGYCRGPSLLNLPWRFCNPYRNQSTATTHVVDPEMMRKSGSERQCHPPHCYCLSCKILNFMKNQVRSMLVQTVNGNKCCLRYNFVGLHTWYHSDSHFTPKNITLNLC